MQSLFIQNATVPTNALAAIPQRAGADSADASYTTVDLLITDGQIVRVTPSAPAVAAPSDRPLLDATGHTLLPGFIDIHVHGGADCDTMDATPTALATMGRFFAQHGVTGYLPTTITAPHAEIRAAVATVATTVAATADHVPTGARILGVHVEGPYISPRYPGAQPPQHIRAPALDEFAELVAAGPVRMITLAPEVAGAQALVKAAREQGVIAVWGHTDATYAACTAAADWGITQATHSYNAMRGLHHREPGTLGATLTLDSIYAQLIADNIHVHPAAMQLLARCKGVERTVLITDAMRAAGLPDGEYELGGQTVTVAAGACRLADGTLAGSILTMDRALQNFMAATGLSLAEAWPATSRTAAQSLGIADQLGTIAPGYQGDLVLLDQSLGVVATVVAGSLLQRDAA